MKAFIYHKTVGALLAALLLVFGGTAFGGDTCIFATTADDIPPYLIILLDNSAEMEQIKWHSGFDHKTDYTPVVAAKDEAVDGIGNGFFNDQGYSIVIKGGKPFLVKILPDLFPDSYANGMVATDPVLGIWTINGRSVTLPLVPSAAVDASGVKDNATIFRYSANYLNWLFFYSGVGQYDGTPLPNVTRFYVAKQALMAAMKQTANLAKFGIYTFTSASSGASNVQPLAFVVNTPLAADPSLNTLDSSTINNINNLGTVNYAPLAEGLASAGGYFASSSSGVPDPYTAADVGLYCQKLFILVVTSGLSSEDQACASKSSPASLSDYDGDSEGNTLTITDGVSFTTYTIPLNQNGSTYLDDVAHYLYTHDIVGYVTGYQPVATYTLGVMTTEGARRFLINASNNGNGSFNLYDETDPDYGKQHFSADTIEELGQALMDAIFDILSATSTFTAPVVPVTRTTSGNSIYMAFFKPDNANFWSGNVTKFGLSKQGDDLVIVDRNGNPATWPNGAIRDEAKPFWTTLTWADPTPDDPAVTNYIAYGARKIYTYLSSTSSLEQFTFGNANITDAMLGTPTSVVVNGTTYPGRTKVIAYTLGADMFDEDRDGILGENREVITGDVLHSEPVVVQYNNLYSKNNVVYFGANDGMLHAVLDMDEVTRNRGTELWAYIPENLLPRLKNMIEGAGHQYYVDSSPKVAIVGGNDDTVVDPGEAAILICGQRKGGNAYFALDVTNPYAMPTPPASWSGLVHVSGQSWAVPQFGKVKTSVGDRYVFVVGGGYDPANGSGKSVHIFDVKSGAMLKSFQNDGIITGMDYSIPSTVYTLDHNNNGYIDKIYVGDMGGNIWRIGRFTAPDGVTRLPYPACDENIDNWTAEKIFDGGGAGKVFYPPVATVERGYDVVFWGTGDREDACNPTTADRLYAVKDSHSATVYTAADLVDVSGGVAADFLTDNGFYYEFAQGEKILDELTVFFKRAYVTTFKPDTSDPCVPGGTGYLYSFGYLTGEVESETDLGGGIPSKPVTVISFDLTADMLISVGSTLPDLLSETTGAGTLVVDPISPGKNIFPLWWRHFFN